MTTDDAILGLREAGRQLTRAIENLDEAVRLLTPQPVSAVDDRQVWVATVPDGDEYGVGPVEVMIERFGNGVPSIAFRRGGNPSCWGAPYQAEPR